MSDHIHLLVQAKETNLLDLLRNPKNLLRNALRKTIEENDKESRKRWLM